MIVLPPTFATSSQTSANVEQKRRFLPASCFAARKPRSNRPAATVWVSSSLVAEVVGGPRAPAWVFCTDRILPEEGLGGYVGCRRHTDMPSSIAIAAAVAFFAGSAW